MFLVRFLCWIASSARTFIAFQILNLSVMALLWSRYYPLEKLIAIEYIIIAIVISFLSDYIEDW